MAFTLTTEHQFINNDTWALIEVISDEDASNPRKEFENFGKMICFHGRYNLGDEHDGYHNSPSDFLRWLAGEVDPTVEDRIDYWNDGAGWVYLSSRYEFRDACKLAECKEDAIIRKALNDHVVMLPLYLYDHSGITMSTGPFSCPWDSGQVGWIYATKEMIREEYGITRISKQLLKKVEVLLESEVKEYDQYLTGDVWGYDVKLLKRHADAEPGSFDENDADVLEEESCWGFFGSDYCLEEARTVAENLAS